MSAAWLPESGPIYPGRGSSTMRSASPATLKSVWQQITQAVRGGQYSAPKTILGFLGAVYVAALGFAFAVVLAIVSVDEVRWLIAPILGFVALGTVVLLVAVLRLAREDPTPLVLGQMTGGEYNEHRRITQGDSLRGERVLVAGAREIVEADQPGQEEDSPTPAAPTLKRGDDG